MSPATLLLVVAATVPPPVYAAPPPPPVPVISHPDWLKKPNVGEIVAAWPRKALEAGVGGRAMIDCRVTVQGVADDCRVVTEEPVDMGFGDAALMLTPQFLFRPATTDGVPQSSRVSIPIAFSHPPKARRALSTTRYDALWKAVWERAPTFEDLGRAYPKDAEGVTDYVAFHCTIKPDGMLNGCFVIKESPQRLDFESSARGLLQLFKADLSMTPEEASRDNLQADIPITLIDPKSAAFRARAVGEPMWTAVADARSFQELPPEAMKAGVSVGRAVVRCTVAHNGHMTNCQAEQADPPNLGFGEKAIEIASVMRMNVWTDAGGPVDGAVILLPVRLHHDPTPSKDDPK